MSTLFSARFTPFLEQKPICVMARSVVENLLDPQRIDALFERTAQRQYTRELLYSTLVDLLGQVVFGIQPSLHAAYQAQRPSVSDQAVYDKLNHAELAVSAELVRDSARQAAAVIEALAAPFPALLPGYTVKILDGNHLAATEHRLEELRTTWVAPLPGKILAVLNPRRMLVEEVFLCENGEASERSMLAEVLATVGAGDLWIADRNFCTFGFLDGIGQRQAAYVIRQHGSITGELRGPSKCRGTLATGRVFEQQLRTCDPKGNVRRFRRITVELKKPTKDGELVIHLLSNLPPDQASAMQIAELYAKRWTIEIVFQELTVTLVCEIKTLGYPKAALLGFCLALVAYHAVSVVKAALRSVHGAATVAQNLSGYYLSLEIKQTYAGMMVALPPGHWKIFRGLAADKMAEALRLVAGHVMLSRYQKHSRGPKKPPPKKTGYKKGGHIATTKLLAGRSP